MSDSFEQLKSQAGVCSVEERTDRVLYLLPPLEPEGDEAEVAAVSQLPSSEIDVNTLPPGATCRSDQPPKFAEFAVIEMPPRQASLPTRRSAGSSSFSTSG